MADLEISKLPPIAGALLQATDPLPLADLSAGESKQVTVKDLIQGGIALIDAGSIPPDKLNFTLQAGTVGTAQLQSHSVTSIKLADNSSVVVGAALPATGAYVGQLGLATTTNKLSIWNGSAWEAFKAAGSLNTLTGGTLGPLTTAVVQTGDTATITAKAADSTAPGQFLAGPAATSGSVTLRGITPEDLPKASPSAIGGISVPVGSGLKVDGGASGLGAQLEIDNTIAASSTPHLVTYDAHGLVTSGRALGSGDLPTATTGAPGVVASGTEFTVPASGVLQHSNQITAGTGIKVSYDAQGHITSSQGLVVADIPNLDAGKITSGTFPTGRLEDKSVTASKLADYAMAYIQEDTPPAGVNAHPIGMTWLRESDGQVSVWNGNSWMKTGASTLFNRNLRYCGTYNPATGLVTGVTQFGTADGFKVGDSIPVADDKHAGGYFVASATGSSSSIAGGASFDAGDWLLCLGGTGGWVRIDTLSGAVGGGGGSSISHFDDLLDVTLSAPKAGDGLRFTAAGQWVNYRSFGQGSTAPLGPTAGSLWLDETTPSAPVLKIYDGTNWVGTGAAVLANGATAPSAPTRGDTWVNTTGTGAPVLNIWDGSKWVTLATTESPTFTGVPAAPTAPAGTSTTQLATTAFVAAANTWIRTGSELAPKNAGDVVSFSKGTAALPGLTPVGDPDTGISSPLADTLAVSTNGVERVQFDALGRTSFRNSAIGAPGTLVDAATITPDFAAANHFNLTIGATGRTLADPTNLVAGQSGCIVITNSGAHTLAYGTAWKFPGGTKPTLPTSATSVLTYYVASPTMIVASLIGDIK